MKALVKKEAKEGLWLETGIEKPKPRRGEVLIEIHKTAICGTDLHIYKWDEWAQKTVPLAWLYTALVLMTAVVRVYQFFGKA